MSPTNVKSEKENKWQANEEDILPLFPEVINGEICTNQFLVASKGVVDVLDNFGKVFAPVKYDMQTNIEKLLKKYLSDRENRQTLQSMILQEKNNNETQIATEALMWLRRGLHMIQSFFDKIIASFETDRHCDDIVACLKRAYKETLEPYHGWMALQLFSLMSRMAPTRTQLLQTLAKNSKEKEEELIIRHMDKFTKRLKENITNLHFFYAQYALETPLMPNLFNLYDL